MKPVISLLFVLATPQLHAGDLEDAAKRLGAYYYKDSEVERRVNWLIGKVPVQLQLSLTYIGYAGNLATGGLITWTKTFP